MIERTAVIDEPTDRRAAAAAAGAAPRGRAWRAMLEACRPRQWPKNGLVAAAPAAAGVLDVPGTLARVVLAFAAFCLLSSATYIVNDLADREQDRAHPVKRRRPIAAGVLAPGAALGAAAILALSGLALAAAVRPLLAAVAAGYLALTLSYSLVWRNIAIADIAAIAAGFLLRAVAGGVAAHVRVSAAFVIVVSLGAILVVAGKRQAELRAASGHLVIQRSAMSGYSVVALRRVIGLACAAAIVTYCLWAFTRPEPSGVPLHALTIPPFTAWLLRYTGLLAQGAGQAPEDLVLGDRLLLVFGASWLALFALSVYVGH